MIKTVDLAKTFITKDKDQIRAIDEVSITLPDKGMVFIIGKSGSGKSTLLNLLAGYEKPTYGEIYVDGIEISNFNETQLGEYQFNDLGFVFQDYSLIETNSVYFNVALSLKDSWKNHKDEIDEVLKRVGLEGYGSRIAGKLSGGEKQRVSLARAIIKNPKIIFCDEPCGNLDGGSSKLVLNILRKQSKKSLVVIVSHNLNDAYTYADRIIELSQGVVISYKAYNEKLSKQKNTEYITDFNALSDDEIARINDGLTVGEINHIYRRKDFFVECDSNTLKQTHEEKEQAESEPKKGHFLLSVLNVFNRRKVRTGVFAFLIGLAMALFAICFTIESFNGDSFYDNAFGEFDYNVVAYNKGAITLNERNKYNATHFSPISQDDRNLIRDAGYEGNYYELYNVDLFTADINEHANHYMMHRQNVGVRVFQDFFTTQTSGVLVTDEEFIKHNLEIDEITYVAQVSDNNWEESGVLITDYVANALMYKRSNDYPSYDSVLGMHEDYTYYNRIYVNAIIDTNYEERFALIAAQMIEDEVDFTALLSDDNLPDYEYLKNALNVMYTTNQNFLEDYRTYNYAVAKNIVQFEYSNGLKRSERDVFSYSSALDSFDENVLLVNIDAVRSFFDLDMSAQEIENELNFGEGKTKLTLMDYGSDWDEADNIIREWNTYEFDRIAVFDEENNYNTDLYNYNTCPRYDLWFYVNSETYNKMFDESYFSFAFFMDDVDGAVAIKNRLKENNIYPSSEIYIAARDLTDAIETYDAIFIMLSIATGAICVVIVTYYGVTLVNANRYNIGVLKSLGYHGKELNRYYMLTLVAFFVLVGSFFVASYAILNGIVNDVIIDALASYANEKIAYFSAFNVFGFNGTLVVIILAIFIVLLSAIALTYLFILRKLRASRILKNKD